MTNNVGEVATCVSLNNIMDNNGANPAAKLAATEYKNDKAVHRNLIGNISANITGTVA